MTQKEEFSVGQNRLDPDWATTRSKRNPEVGFGKSKLVKNQEVFRFTAGAEEPMWWVGRILMDIWDNWMLFMLAFKSAAI